MRDHEICKSANWNGLVIVDAVVESSRGPWSPEGKIQISIQFNSIQLFIFEAKREKEGKELFKSKAENPENMKNHSSTIEN